MTNLATSTPHVGTVLGDRYELVRHIARGGMGDVYEGTDRVLQRAVAVKLFRSAAAADRARFDAEVHVLAGLGHQGLVRVYDAGPHGDDAYVVLELIDGPPLSQVLHERGPLHPDDVAQLGREIADALAYIHERGVVHRDVTPANVLCDQEGRPRLVDFGIARLLDGPRVTTTSLTVGTPSYMAPEQLQGGEVTPAADVYSLGLVLLEALTGRQAFEGTVQETAVARLARGPDVPTELPSQWQEVLTAMTQPDPAGRPSAAEVRDRLVVVQGTQEVPVLGADAPTQVMAASSGGTQVMPVPVLVPDEPATPAPGTTPVLAPAERGQRSWTPLWWAGAAVVAVLVLLLVANAGGDGLETPPLDTTPSSLVEQADAGDTQVTQAPTTQAPTTTVPATLPAEDLLPSEGFPFDPNATPPGLDDLGKDRKDKDDD